MITPRQRRIVEAAGRRYHVDPAKIYGVWGAETGFSTDPNIGSSAGAVGPTQFLPPTAESLGINPHKLRGALFGTAKYLSEYKDRGPKGMIGAYNAGPAGDITNPETAAYIPKVLRYAREYKVRHGPVEGVGGNPPTSEMAPIGPITPVGPRLSEKFATLASLNQSQPQNAYAPEGPENYQFLEELSRKQEGQENTTRQLMRAAQRSLKNESIVPNRSETASIGGTKSGKVVFSSGADRAGVHTQPVVKQFLSDLAGSIGAPITVGTGTNHSQYTVDGNVSDHWTGHAVDIPVPVDSSQGDLVAGRALMLVGYSREQARKMAQQGGLYTITPTSGPFKGRRVQVIWKTEEGGNHHGHVHTGIH